MEKQKSPEVRFKGFSDGWKQQTLGDMFIPLSNNTLSRADLNYDNGQIKNIHYGDILVKYAAVLDYKNDKIPFITDGKISDFKSQLLQNGDVIFADTAEDEVVGKAIEINVPADTFIVSGLHTMAYRPKAKLSSFYLGHYLNSNAYHHQLLPLMQGVKVLSISRTNLAKTIVRYPLSEQEQTQIGNFFQNLDQSIALHEKKLAQTQNLKKAMLEKMFPKAGDKQPEIRLKGFSGDWEQTTLGEIADIYDGTHQTPRYTSSGIMFLSVENIVSLQSKKYISEEDFVNDFSVFPVRNDILMTRIGDIGTANIVNSDEKLAYYVSLALLKPKKVNPEYLAKAISSEIVQKGIWRRTLHIAFPKKINKNEINNVEILVPMHEDEQSRVGNFFKQLDETLVLQQQQLQTLKNLKQAFLEKMFV